MKPYETIEKINIWNSNSFGFCVYRGRKFLVRTNRNIKWECMRVRGSNTNIYSIPRFNRFIYRHFIILFIFPKT